MMVILPVLGLSTNYYVVGLSTMAVWLGEMDCMVGRRVQEAGRVEPKEAWVREAPGLATMTEWMEETDWVVREGLMEDGPLTSKIYWYGVHSFGFETLSISITETGLSFFSPNFLPFLLTKACDMF